MPRLKLTKSAIDVLPTPAKDIVYWDSGCPGFGVKITPKGRKVFIVLYRAGGAGSQLRKYTIGPYGRVTLHQARAAAVRIFAARTEGRDPAAEKQLERRRLVADGVEDQVELFISEHVSKTRSAREISRLLRREVILKWGMRSVHEVSKRIANNDQRTGFWHLVEIGDAFPLGVAVMHQPVFALKVRSRIRVERFMSVEEDFALVV
ncbi:MAG: Arm DNA-binding domain-containing protein [Methyloceanibacter sp.]